MTAVADSDGYNWGYDPWHFSTPEGSYAQADHQDGGARTAEFRGMVGALHQDGLQVVLDQVFNHTSASGQADRSVLDQVVPGYYQRLDRNGAVYTSTCCQNVATEHAMAQKLMVDSVVTWARDYKVDGFRFDLMGHHSTDNMLAVRAALDALTPSKDGIDGTKIYLYGEGWNFGEVANDALFTQARQGNLGRHRHRHVQRPAARRGQRRFAGGRAIPTSTRASATGWAPTPTAPDQGDSDLGARTDWVRLGLAGNLRSFSFLTASGQVAAAGDADRLQRLPRRLRRRTGRGHQLRRRARQPDPVRHADREAAGGDLDGRPGADEHAVAGHRDAVPGHPVLARRAPTCCAASRWTTTATTPATGSTRIDWTGQDNGFGRGLPPAADNSAISGRSTGRCWRIRR